MARQRYRGAALDYDAPSPKRAEGADARARAAAQRAAGRARAKAMAAATPGRTIASVAQEKREAATHRCSACQGLYVGSYAEHAQTNRHRWFA